MLLIRPEQVQIFKEQVLDCFISRMLGYMHLEISRADHGLVDAELRCTILNEIEDAEKYESDSHSHRGNTAFHASDP